MWRNKKWVITIVLAVVTVMAVGVIGGVVYAQSGTTTTTPNNPKDALMAKVAEKLGIDQSKLEDAFTQASKELRQEALSNQLKKLVDEGKMTQDQADKYLQWVQSKPDVPAGLGMGPKMGPRGPMGFRGGPGCFPGTGKFAPPPQPTETPTN